MKNTQPTNLRQEHICISSDELAIGRRIEKIIVHCSATPAGRNIGVDEIRRWHQQRGFADVGYHYVVRTNGNVEAGRPLSKIGAHCKGQNAKSIGVCYVGGLDENLKPCDTRTPQQKEALEKLLRTLLRRFPYALIYGHNEFAAKACPCFNASREYMELMLTKLNHEIEDLL